MQIHEMLHELSRQQVTITAEMKSLREQLEKTHKASESLPGQSTNEEFQLTLWQVTFESIK